MFGTTTQSLYTVADIPKSFLSWHPCLVIFLHHARPNTNKNCTVSTPCSILSSCVHHGLPTARSLLLSLEGHSCGDLYKHRG